jgi:membrane protease YdiL (CAAX protease family)
VRSARTSSVRVAQVPETPLGRRPEPDVPPPPAGSWPLADAKAPPGTGRAATGYGRGPIDGPFLTVPPFIGLGLSLVSIGLYFVAMYGIQVAAALILVGTGILSPSVFDPSEIGSEALGLGVASQSGALLVTLLFLRIRRTPLRQLVGGLRPVGRSLGLGVGLGLLAVVASSLIVTLLVTLSGSDAAPEQVITQRLVTGSTVDLVLVAFAAVVVAPIAEELLFRGLLHRSLRTRMRIVPATVLSSVLFAVVHVDIALSQPLGLVGLALVGAVHAVAYERTGGLVVPILIHAVHNAVGIVALLAVTRFDIDLATAGAALLGVGR